MIAWPRQRCFVPGPGPEVSAGPGHLQGCLIAVGLAGRRVPRLMAAAHQTSVVRIHSGNGQHEEMDRRAIACFDQALQDVGLTAGPVRQVLHDYFAWATTTTMARYHESADDVPEGLSIPRWSWSGLQR